VKTDGTGLTTAVVAAELPDDEVGYEIESYLNFILIGTSKGVRVAQADSNGDLTLGSIIPASQPVRCFEGQDRFEDHSWLPVGAWGCGVVPNWECVWVGPVGFDDVYDDCVDSCVCE